MKIEFSETHDKSEFSANTLVLNRKGVLLFHRFPKKVIDRTIQSSEDEALLLLKGAGISDNRVNLSQREERLKQKLIEHEKAEKYFETQKGRMTITKSNNPLLKNILSQDDSIPNLISNLEFGLNWINQSNDDLPESIRSSHLGAQYDISDMK